MLGNAVKDFPPGNVDYAIECQSLLPSPVAEPGAQLLGLLACRPLPAGEVINADRPKL